jgi:drug/metabolite transporter (DMT)-like permease
VEILWIPITIFAALMQAVRTAAQKDLNRHMSTMGTTYVRSIFGLPVMLIYLAAIMVFVDDHWPTFSPYYLFTTFSGALAQILATALLIQMFQLKNFAVGSMLTKTDIIMTAIIGTALFSEKVSGTGWLIMVVIFGGVVLMLLGKLGADVFRSGGGTLAAVFSRTTLPALACAFMFALSYLFLRQATLELGDANPVWRGAWTVVVATSMQVAGVGLWLAWRERVVFTQLWPNRKMASFIGLTSAIGSIGWFTAFALQNASYVRAVGQIEAVFTLAISWLYFKEKITGLELIGILVTIAGVLMFRLL